MKIRVLLVVISLMFSLVVPAWLVGGPVLHVQAGGPPTGNNPVGCPRPNHGSGCEPD